jgi:hypothetical protein
MRRGAKPGVATIEVVGIERGEKIVKHVGFTVVEKRRSRWGGRAGIVRCILGREKRV